MPLYEYRCDTCERTFEVQQKFSDSPLTQCEVCAGSVRRLISRTSFQLKGTGWYASDYKKPAQPSPGLPTVSPPPSSVTAETTEKKPAESGKTEKSKETPSSTKSDKKTS